VRTARLSSRRRRAQRITAPLAAAGVAALMVAGCGHAEPAFTATTPHPDASGAVGAALAVADSSGTKLEVTVVRVIDPASGADPYTKAAKGKHFVAVQIKVHNVGRLKYQNNANNETTIVLANGSRVEADYNPLVQCGNFDNGQVVLAAGASKSGCVSFQLASGANVAKVEYRNTVFPGTGAVWTLR
jgi:Domain of unknown function (DUF4352)